MIGTSYLVAETARTADCGPWVCKQRPAGDWVVDQLDRLGMTVRRFGPYPTEAAARAVYAELKGGRS